MMTKNNHALNFSATKLPLRGLTLLTAALLCGCATYPGSLPSAGASREEVQVRRDDKQMQGIQFVSVNDDITSQLLKSQKQAQFSDVFASSMASAYVIGAGDSIEISVWEAPPAMLFGSSLSVAKIGPGTSQATTFPEQMVSSDGTITMPFAGHIQVAGHTPEWIEESIVQRLKNKANQPQVLVRVLRNNTAAVTVVGEVATSARMPLTARGERLLDALANAGGVRQPVNKMTLQITRGALVKSLPLELIIRDPKQNVLLQPGDVVTALFQPASFTMLGAAGKNEEINFEAQGISLIQALGRSGGLNDSRADARGVFIFRFEEEHALTWESKPKTTADGKVPVIYQVDLKDPASFFLAQNFTIQNKDVLYISNAPAAELQKFLNIIVSSVYPFAAIKSVKPNL